MQLVRLCEVDVLYEFLQYTGASVMANNSDNALRRTLQYPHIGSLSRVISGGLPVAMCQNVASTGASQHSKVKVSSRQDMIRQRFPCLSRQLGRPNESRIQARIKMLCPNLPSGDAGETRTNVICITMEPNGTVVHDVLVNGKRNPALEILSRWRFASINESYSVNFVFESGIINMLISHGFERSHREMRGLSIPGGRDTCSCVIFLERSVSGARAD